MSDRITQYSTLSFSLTLERNGEVENRTFQIETDTAIDNLKSNVNTFRQLLLNKYDHFFQPTNWRDSNIAEEEWLTSGVKVKYIIRRETEFDFT